MLTCLSEGLSKCQSFSMLPHCPRAQCSASVQSLFLPPLSPLLFFPVTHARQRCSTAEFGGTSGLKLESHTKLTMIFFSPSISACKCLPLHCQSLSVCIGTAGLLELLFALCSHCVLIQPGTRRNKSVYHPGSHCMT